MIIKADSDELDLFVKKMRNDSNDFSDEIDNIISLINQLGDVWQGIDATTFQNNISNYLEKMKVVPKALVTLSNVTDRINKGYLESDEAFTNALKEVTKKYE